MVKFITLMVHPMVDFFTVLIPSNVDINILKISIDTHGKILLQHCENERLIHLIVNIYAPTEDDTNKEIFL